MIACIPSKGRSKTVTYKLFEEVGITALHFIEPQDADSYSALKTICIGKNDMGVGFARQFILDWCKANQHQWVIMCDDDITAFGDVIDRKCVKKNAGIFFDILTTAKKLPFALYGINFRQYAWSETKNYSINSKVFTAVTIMNTDLLQHKYPDTLKEDITFLFEAIRLTPGVMKFNKYWFNTPPVGTNQGGCFDAYQQGEQDTMNAILNQYKGYVKVVSKKDRDDIKWDVAKFAADHKRKIV